MDKQKHVSIISFTIILDKHDYPRPDTPQRDLPQLEAFYSFSVQ